MSANTTVYCLLNEDRDTQDIFVCSNWNEFKVEMDSYPNRDYITGNLRKHDIGYILDLPQYGSYVISPSIAEDILAEGHWLSDLEDSRATSC